LSIAEAAVLDERAAALRANEQFHSQADNH